MEPAPIRTLSIQPKDRNTSEPTLGIQLLNYTNYSTAEMQEWISTAESKMESRRASVFAFIYPIGPQIKPAQKISPGHPYWAHEVLLKPEEINYILGEVEEWLNSQVCNEYTDYHLDQFRGWLEGGADPATSYGICSTVRVVAIGVGGNMAVDKLDFQNVVFHEFYHAFQQDLHDGGVCRERADMNEWQQSIWFFEGAAHYFSTILLFESNNRGSPINEILRIASRVYAEGPDGINSQPDKWGAAALRLMIEKDLLAEDTIIDGSLFHNCARELEYDSTSSSMEHITNSWYLIEKDNGIHKFTKEALTK